MELEVFNYNVLLIFENIMVSLILLCLLFQLPIKVVHQNTHTKISTEHNKECLINISKYKFSLVISGLTNILKTVNNMVRACFLSTEVC